MVTQLGEADLPALPRLVLGRLKGFMLEQFAVMSYGSNTSSPYNTYVTHLRRNTHNLFIYFPCVCQYLCIILHQYTLDYGTYNM